MKREVVIRNRAKCLICGEILESVSRHDHKTCRCGSLSVDGGLDYTRRSFRKEGCYEELSEVRLEDEAESEEWSEEA